MIKHLNIFKRHCRTKIFVIENNNKLKLFIIKVNYVCIDTANENMKSGGARHFMNNLADKTYTIQRSRLNRQVLLVQTGFHLGTSCIINFL